MKDFHRHLIHSVWASNKQVRRRKERKKVTVGEFLNLHFHNNLKNVLSSHIWILNSLSFPTVPRTPKTELGRKSYGRNKMGLLFIAKIRTVRKFAPVRKFCIVRIFAPMRKFCVVRKLKNLHCAKIRIGAKSCTAKISRLFLWL